MASPNARQVSTAALREVARAALRARREVAAAASRHDSPGLGYMAAREVARDICIMHALDLHSHNPFLRLNAAAQSHAAARQLQRIADRINLGTATHRTTP